MKKAGRILADLDKKGKMLDFRDVLIGAIALTNQYSLKTNNRKHFKEEKKSHKEFW